jgi:hypothetical protein
MFGARAPPADPEFEGVSVDPVSGAVRSTPAANAAGIVALRAAIDAALAKGTLKQVVRTDDAFLLAFLRARKFKISAALLVHNSFSDFWYAQRGLLDGLCAEKVRHIYGLGFMQLLGSPGGEGGKDVHGNSITVLRMAKMDYGTFSPREMIQLSVYILLAMFDDENMQIHGAAYVETMQDFSIMQSMAMQRALSKEDSKLMMTVGLDTFPMRIREIYLMQQPRWFGWFWAIVRLFLKEKLRKRLHVLGTDFEALHRVVHPSVLPAEFGGTNADSPTKFLDELEAKEKAQGKIGGFVLPLRTDDPCGLRRAEAAAGSSGEAAPTVHWDETE